MAHLKHTIGEQCAEHPDGEQVTKEETAKLSLKNVKFLKVCNFSIFGRRL